jgi:hypothetical protein
MHEVKNNITPTPVDQATCRVVCRTCGASPINGVALFSFMAGGERHRFCPEHLPLAEVRRRLEAPRGPLLDHDVLAIFTARLAER